MNTFVLKHPYKNGLGDTVETFTLQDLKVKDMRRCQRIAGGDSVALELQLFACFCGITPEDLDNMSLLDYNRVRARFSKLYDSDDDEQPKQDGGTTGAVVSDAAE